MSDSEADSDGVPPVPTVSVMTYGESDEDELYEPEFDEDDTPVSRKEQGNDNRPDSPVDPEPAPATTSVVLPPPIATSKCDLPTLSLSVLPTMPAAGVTRRYFVAKPRNHMKMSDSIALEVWSTRASNAPHLNDAFRTGAEVVVFFSVNMSQHVQVSSASSYSSVGTGDDPLNPPRCSRG